MILMALVAATVLVLGGIALVRHDRVAAVGEEIVYDDFGFTVRGARSAKTLGPAGREVTAEGAFWIVDLEVANHARRVPYRLEWHTPLLLDSRGNTHRVSPGGQAALEAEHVFPVPPQELAHSEKCVTTLVYDVPEDAGDLRLKISCGGQPADLIDYVLLGDWSLALRSP
jgi:hypothetical protein